MGLWNVCHVCPFGHFFKGLSRPSDRNSKLKLQYSIAPVVLTPALVTLIYLEHRAVKSGKKGSEKADEDAVDAAVLDPLHNAPWPQKVKKAFIEIDAFGLLLLGFGWSLVRVSNRTHQFLAADFIASSFYCHLRCNRMQNTATATAL